MVARPLADHLPSERVVTRRHEVGDFEDGRVAKQVEDGRRGGDGAEHAIHLRQVIPNADRSGE